MPRLPKLRDFLTAIDGRLPVATPLIETIAADGGYTIERRLPGRTMTAVVGGLAGEARRRAFGNYLEAATAFRSIEFAERPYGELLAAAPLTAPDWHAYLRASLARYLAANGEPIATEVGAVEGLAAKALALLDGVAAAPPKILVHGDYFPGNVLMDDALGVAGVVDFSSFTVVGDPLLDLAGAYVFPEMAGQCGPEDSAAMRDWLLDRHGEAIVAPVLFYRAYFAFAMAHPVHASGLYPGLYSWCLGTLAALRDGQLAF